MKSTNNFTDYTTHSFADHKPCSDDCNMHTHCFMSSLHATLSLMATLNFELDE